MRCAHPVFAKQDNGRSATASVMATNPAVGSRGRGRHALYCIWGVRRRQWRIRLRGALMESGNVQEVRYVPWDRGLDCRPSGYGVRSARI